MSYDFRAEISMMQINKGEIRCGFRARLDL
jgi:hypothetical protein